MVDSKSGYGQVPNGTDTRASMPYKRAQAYTEEKVYNDLMWMDLILGTHIRSDMASKQPKSVPDYEWKNGVLSGSSRISLPRRPFIRPGSLQPNDPIRRGRLSKDHPTSALPKQPQQRSAAACLIDLNSGTLEIAGVSPRGRSLRRREREAEVDCALRTGHSLLGKRSTPSGNDFSSSARRPWPLLERAIRGTQY